MTRMLAFLLLSVFAALPARAETLRMAVTTSFNNSGLSEVLLPAIKEDLGIEIQLLIVGTGQALRLGRSGDVDAILVHSKAAEEKFVEEGFGTHRREIMYNDFVVVGPKDDPAGIATAKSAVEAFQRIARARAVFVSRGDDSGTHRRELALWASAGLNPETFDPSWYRAAGAGMGATLNTAAGMGGYVMSDRASWLNFANKSELEILFSGDPALFNQYAFLPVNPAMHEHVKYDVAMQVEDWLVSAKAQAMIAAYQIAGETLFTPNATP